LENVLWIRLLGTNVREKTWLKIYQSVGDKIGLFMQRPACQWLLRIEMGITMGEAFDIWHLWGVVNVRRYGCMWFELSLPEALSAARRSLESYGACRETLWCVTHLHLSPRRETEHALRHAGVLPPSAPSGCSIDSIVSCVNQTTKRSINRAHSTMNAITSHGMLPGTP